MSVTHSLPHAPSVTLTVNWTADALSCLANNNYSDVAEPGQAKSWHEKYLLRWKVTHVPEAHFATIL